MANEVKVKAEGSFWLVQASGANPTGWNTGVTPVSALLGYVESFTFASGRNLVTMSDRGIPKHHKEGSKMPIDVTINFKWTGAYPQAASAAGGGTVPLWHGELKYTEKDVGAASGRYYQFYGIAEQQAQFTENEDGNVIAVTYRALGMSGANTTGFMP